MIQWLSDNASLGPLDSAENARAYALKHRLPYSILFDANIEVSAHYQIQTVPRFYLVEQNGRIAASATRVPHKALAAVLGETDT